MPIANDVYGTVFEKSSAVLLARVVLADGQLISSSEISAVSYTVYEIDPCQPDHRTAVTGHDGVPLSAGAVLYGTLQTGNPWTVDGTGYNFRHDLNVSTVPAFPNAGRTYQVRYEMQPTVGQVIVFRFQVKAI